MGVRWDVALRSDGSRVWIWESSGERLFCPECEGEMIPVKGPQTRHHFRHKVADCPGESAIHWAKKYEVADALEGLGTVMVERKSGEYIPDVLFKDEWFFEFRSIGTATAAQGTCKGNRGRYVHNWKSWKIRNSILTIDGYQTFKYDEVRRQWVQANGRTEMYLR